MKGIVEPTNFNEEEDALDDDPDRHPELNVEVDETMSLAGCV